MENATRYRNPWKHNGQRYVDAFYEHNLAPVRVHRGFSIYRIHDAHFDIVKDGVCITQRAGDTNKGLNRVIDNIVDGNGEEWTRETMEHSGVKSA